MFVLYLLLLQTSGGSLKPEIFFDFWTQYIETDNKKDTVVSRKLAIGTSNVFGFFFDNDAFLKCI